MSRSAINAAIVQAYGDADLGIPTAYEGKSFDNKPTNAPWAELTLLPVSTDQSLQTVDKEKFLFQIDLYFPSNKGTRPIHDAIDTLTAYFKPKRRFASTPQPIRILTRDASRVRDGGGWQVCSLTIVFDCVTDR